MKAPKTQWFQGADLISCPTHVEVVPNDSWRILDNLCEYIRELLHSTKKKKKKKEPEGEEFVVCLFFG